jgi:TolB-like protein/Flp pilus assembly protein TadD
MPLRTKKAFCFQGFSLDLERGCLHREGRAIDLRPKSFELLRYLVENAGRLIPKEELIRAIWARVVVSDESLARCISDVRSALGDAEQRIIKTAPRRGYLFAAPVSLQAAAAVAPMDTAPLIARAPRLSLVVLPFANLGETALDRFVDGITETLTTDLSRARGASVIAAHTALAYKGKATDVRGIGRELGVRYVIEGSIQGSDDRIRVNVQLIDAETGNHIWAERFDKRRGDVFDMQDEIAVRLARALMLEMFATESRRAECERPDNMDAIDLSLCGGAINRGPFSMDGTRKARGFFEAALRLDERNVHALIGLANTHTTEVLCFASDNPMEQLRIAETAIAKALILEPSSARVHDTRGRLLHARRAPDAALREFELAISLVPGYPIPYVHAGNMKVFLGRAEEAHALVAEAIRLSPHDASLNEWYYILGIADFCLGKLDKSVDRLRRSVEINPNFPLPFLYIAAASALMGDKTEAAQACARIRDLLPNFRRASQASPWSDNPVFLDQRERLIEGLRKAGLPR